MSDPLYALTRPFLFRLDAERAHHLVLDTAEKIARSPALCTVVETLYGAPKDPRLEQKLLGLTLPTPIGLAAGLDKDGVAIDFWAALGFGFVEVGTVTPGSGQPGNDPPRLARVIPGRALVNRMGFNNKGADALAVRLKQRRTKIPVGANIGKAKATPLDRAAEDYVACLRAVWAEVDYVTINVSSPNTPGLRDLQAVSALEPLLTRVIAENRSMAKDSGKDPRPILLKISPDLADEDLDRVADLSIEVGIDGIIATNTTMSAPFVTPFPGGISGKPLHDRALACTERLSQRIRGRIPIVGVGGISSADDAWERIRAGAQLVQIYSALIYEGPGLVRALTRGLLARIERDGYSNLEAALPSAPDSGA
jgi:dihydroorotate dehydrogenase